MNSSARVTSLLCAAVSLAALSALAPGCLDRRSEDTSPKTLECTSCHGSPNNPGSDLVKSAPPIDLNGNTDPSYPGVGAHQNHLHDGPTHAAVPCQECHVVPTTTGQKGHADTDRPAELTFGELAKTGGRDPSYSAAARSCTDTYCHQNAETRWTHPRSSADACGSCHALPPPLPHPAVEQCENCHGEVIGANMKFIAPEKHVNGKVEVIDLTCSTCHGSEQNAAPPVDTQGNSDITAIGVGAHQVHLAGGANSRPVACGECHVVPKEVGDPGHIDTAPAEVIFTGVATTSGRAPDWNRTAKKCSDSWCHGPSATGTDSPEWTSTAGNLSCTTCHGAPPPAPHPQMTNCNFCHGAVVGADNQTIVNRDLHVNGTVDVVLPTTCNACHGSQQNAAPPVDLSGHTATSFPGVGAHQTHLSGGITGRPVECVECHVVPASVDAPGHYDTAGPAELTFSGVATLDHANGTNVNTPTYDGVSCTNTYCHGGSWNSNGSNTAPTWTGVNQAPCGACHGFPPPAPHPNDSSCSTCHTKFSTDKTTHIDGKVTF
ncbi:MAG: CxxxxCH/CxxCH domain-containing protein [Myxococcales bacterium]|nr:CxxxxCH/CxxCH domain-containing protein [Myxococcales bacterium]